MYSRSDIIRNQRVHYKNILSFFKSEVSHAKKELYAIKTKDEDVNKELEKLKAKSKGKYSVEQEVNKYIISERNRYPNLYLWWDEKNKLALIFKTVNETR